MALIRVEVVYALQAHPEIDVDSAEFGIWSERVTHDCLAQDGDRVEIYRPLIADPKIARRKRAQEGKPRRGRRK